MKNITPKDYDSIDGLKQFNADVVTDALANPEKWMGDTYESLVKVRDIWRYNLLVVIHTLFCVLFDDHNCFVCWHDCDCL